MCVHNNNPLTDRSPDERRETRGGAKVKPWRRRPQAPHNYRDDFPDSTPYRYSSRSDDERYNGLSLSEPDGPTTTEKTEEAHMPLV